MLRIHLKSFSLGRAIPCALLFSITALLASPAIAQGPKKKPGAKNKANQRPSNPRAKGAPKEEAGFVPKQESEREWSNASGDHRTQATLLYFYGDQVTLRRADGKEIIVPFNKLSQADVDYLNGRKGEKGNIFVEMDPDQLFVIEGKTCSSPLGMPILTQQLCSNVETKLRVGVMSQKTKSMIRETTVTVYPGVEIRMDFRKSPGSELVSSEYDPKFREAWKELCTYGEEFSMGKHFSSLSLKLKRDPPSHPRLAQADKLMKFADQRSETANGKVTGKGWDDEQVRDFQQDINEMLGKFPGIIAGDKAELDEGMQAGLTSLLKLSALSKQAELIHQEAHKICFVAWSSIAPLSMTFSGPESQTFPLKIAIEMGPFRERSLLVVNSSSNELHHVTLRIKTEMATASDKSEAGKTYYAFFDKLPKNGSVQLGRELVLSMMDRAYPDQPGTLLTCSLWCDELCADNFTFRPSNKKPDVSSGAPTFFLVPTKVKLPSPKAN